MQKKIVGWKTRGMNRDLSVSAFNPEFSFENRNMRLSTNDGNTMLSWVNERGPKQVTLKIDTNPWREDVGVVYSDIIEGTPIGTAVLNDTLVVFTTEELFDRIYILKHVDNPDVEGQYMEGKILYKGNLNFSAQHPLETLSSYETTDIQKVYWTDGYNQPRLINIAADTSKLRRWHSDTSDKPDSFFDFVPAFNTESSIEIEKELSGGVFAPGTIQYCFTYVNKYGQQSNVVQVSPLYYCSHADRGASPEESTNNSFKIKIKDVDTSFDYIRLYSIQRTLKNGTPIVKLLDDIDLRDIKTGEEVIYPSPYYADIECTTDTIDATQYASDGIRRLPRTASGEDTYISGCTCINGYYTSSYATQLYVSTPKNDIDVVGNAASGYQQTYFLLGNQALIDYIEATFPELVVRSDLYVQYKITSTLKNAVEAKYRETHSDVPEFTSIEIQALAGDNLIPTVFRIEGNEAFRGDYYITFDFTDQSWHYSTAPIEITPHPDTIQPDPITKEYTYVSYNDTGDSGSTVDSMELQFAGGKDITALTMAEKDNTLFLGNITQYNYSLTSIQEYFDSVRDTEDASSIEFRYNNQNKHTTYPPTTSAYDYVSTIHGSSSNITTFKGGETYRFGFQLQKATGEWSDPIYINDAENTLYPRTSVLNGTVDLIEAFTVLSIETIKEQFGSQGDFYKLYKSIRPVIVFPQAQDRTVLCQGVLNPTVFNVVDRNDNSPFAQSSWFFRPYCMPDNRKFTSVVIPQAPSFATDMPSGWEEGNTFFSAHNMTQTVYILEVLMYATVSTDSKALKYGVITVDYAEDTPNTTHDTERDPGYIGYIPLGSETQGGTALNRYLLVKRTPWVDPSTVSYTYRTGTLFIIGTTIRRKYNPNVIHRLHDSDQVWGGTETNVLFSGMHSYGGLIYYTRPDIEGAPSTYKFTYNRQGAHYLVQYFITFTHFSQPYPFDVAADPQGAILPFRHYDTLVEDEDFLYIDDSGSTPKAVGFPSENLSEIQGAHNIIDGVFSAGVLPTRPVANSQFFIDQSIVTLHSPDIEFDQSLSNIGTEGFKLRVIGVVPITSHVSSHSIKTSSSMEGLKMSTQVSGEDPFKYGVGELGVNTFLPNLSLWSGRHLCSQYMWNDSLVGLPRTDSTTQKQKVSTSEIVDHAVFPWQRTGSLSNDLRKTEETSSLLSNKREADSMYSTMTEYLPNVVYPVINSAEVPVEEVAFDSIGFQFHHTENNQILNMRLPKQHEGAFDINYYPNIDKLLYNTTGYTLKYSALGDKCIFGTVKGNGDSTPYYIDNAYKSYDPVAMKYMSTSHAVISLQATDEKVPLLPNAYYNNSGMYLEQGGSLSSEQHFYVGYYTNAATSTPYWGDSNLSFEQSSITMDPLESRFFDFLWLGEIYRDIDSESRFGGQSKNALKANKWLIGGKSVSLSSRDSEDKITLIWDEGDTYFQRYDAMKTYASTQEDPNSVVEILSFMCETHTNIDGRYDKNRGQQHNHNMRPEVFNVLNPAYTQSNNFFTYKKMYAEGAVLLDYPQYISYSKTKTSGADIDLYTNTTLGSVLELEGDSGNIKGLERWNDRLIAFQDTGISQILYNENVQVSSEQGVPIEIANSGKVQGARYLSNTVGCSNKWSIVNTPNGIYFIDSVSKSIYLLADGLLNLSSKAGMNAWVKQNIPQWDKVWNPEDFENFTAYYDKINQEVYFINSNDSLVYSEQMGAFTSFYSYEETPYFVSVGDTSMWLSQKKGDEVSSDYKLWQHHAGDYCNFFGENKPYSITLIGNPDPQMDKIFTNLEMRAVVEGDGEYNELTHKFTPTLPFSSLETWDDYQHGIANLVTSNNMEHHTSDNNGSLLRKFRIWRCDIPRNNYPYETYPVKETGETEEHYQERVEAYNAWLKGEKEKGISRYAKKPLDRMRNPWLYLKLEKSAQEDMPKVELHDLLMTYFE